MEPVGCPKVVQAIMHIAIEDPATPDVRELLEEHLRDMRTHSPPESVHALDVRKLQHPDITFWTVREGGLLLGCGALKQLDPVHGEIKSMRTPAALRRQGAGRAMLEHIIGVARGRGYERLSLETGSMEVFLPAQRLYQQYGFSYCDPFGQYRPDPNSVFMTLRL
jgi:putative acetyltransferase